MANGEGFCHLNNDEDIDDDDHEDDDDDKWRVRVCCCSSCELELPQLPCVLLSIRLTSQWSQSSQWSSQWSSQSSGFHFSSCNDVNGAAIAKAKEDVGPQISIVGSIRALVHSQFFHHRWNCQWIGWGMVWLLSNRRGSNNFNIGIGLSIDLSLVLLNIWCGMVGLVCTVLFIMGSCKLCITWFYNLKWAMNQVYALLYSFIVRCFDYHSFLGAFDLFWASRKTKTGLTLSPPIISTDVITIFIWTSFYCERAEDESFRASLSWIFYSVSKVWGPCYIGTNGQKKILLHSSW